MEAAERPVTGVELWLLWESNSRQSEPIGLLAANACGNSHKKVARKAAHPPSLIRRIYESDSPELR